MAAPVVPSTLSPALQRRLAEHREAAKCRREQYGDPLEHFAWVVRELFDQESLEEAVREHYEGRSWGDDDLDEE